MAPRRPASSAGPPGHVEAADLQAEAQRHRVLLLAPGGAPVRRTAGGARPRRRRPTPGARRRSPRAPSASSARPRPRAQLARDARPTGRPRAGPRLRARASRSGVSTTTAWHGTPAAVGEAAEAGAHGRLEGGRVDDRRAARGRGAWRRSARAPRWRPSSPAGRGGAARRPPAGRPWTRSRPPGTSGAAHVDLPAPATPTSTTRHGSGGGSSRPLLHLRAAPVAHCDTPSSCSAP